ncbi:MAG: hypothetical protein QXS81_04765 [Candidatus Micrarchaeaceae archaeon]
METSSSSEYLQKTMNELISAAGMPICFICGKRIVGAHLDYIDKDREPRKICIGCAYIAIDYYLKAREEHIWGIS